MKHAGRMISILLLGLLLCGCSHFIEAVEQQAASETETSEAETLSISGSTAAAEDAEVLDPDTMRIEVPKSAAALGLVHLMEEASMESTQGKYRIELKDTEAEALSDFITGRTDAALLSPESAARAYQTTKDDTVVVNICDGNDLYCISGNSALTSFQGLKGQEVLVVGQGEQPQYVLEYLVSQYGTRFNISYVSADDVITLLTQNPMGAAIVPEPEASRILAAVPGVQRVFSLKDSWENVADTGSLISTVTVVHRTYYESQREAVDNLRREMALSIVKAGRDAAQTAKLSAKYGVAEAETAAAALPYAGLRCTIGDQMNRSILSYLGNIASVNAAAVGQTLPGDTFFYGYVTAEPETSAVTTTASYDEDEDEKYEDDTDASDTVKDKKKETKSSEDNEKQETKKTDESKKNEETKKTEESKKTDESKKGEETKKSDESKKSEETKKAEERKKTAENVETKSAPAESVKKQETEAAHAPVETAASPQPAAPDPSAAPGGPSANDDVISDGPVG